MTMLQRSFGRWCSCGRPQAGGGMLSYDLGAQQIRRRLAVISAGNTRQKHDNLEWLLKMA